MNIQENDKNIYTKERSELERYLMRIIQRYFDMQNTETQNSIEAIIVESLTRMKRDILHERSFVFSVNGVAGHLVINADFVSAEPAFYKNTAFNKDFGVMLGTICSGDDYRLSNDRPPLQHNHSQYTNFIDKLGIPIVDSQGRVLQTTTPGQTLGDLLRIGDVTSNADFHSHLNYDSVLKRLKYTGSRTEIDLAYLDVLKANLRNKLDSADSFQNNLDSQVENALSGLQVGMDRSQALYEQSCRLAQIPPGWYEDSITYTNEVIVRTIRYCQDYIDSLVTQSEFNTFVANTSIKYINAIEAGDIEVQDSDYVDNVSPTLITSKFTLPIAIPDTSNGTMVSKIDAYLSCNILVGEDKKRVNIPLPIIQKQSDGSIVYIHCQWDSNNASIIGEIIIPITEDVQESNIYDESRIIKIYNEKLTLNEMDTFSRLHPVELCLIDCQEKLDFIGNFLSPDEEYCVNGKNFYIENDTTYSGWYGKIDNKKVPLVFFNTEGQILFEIDFPSCMLISGSDKKMIPGVLIDSPSFKFIYEYRPFHLTKYFDSPSFSYIIYTGELEEGG